MDPAHQDLVLESIYDAAVQGGNWSPAVLALAEAIGGLASIDYYDRSSGLLRMSHNPTIEAKYIADFLRDWHMGFSYWKRVADLPVGRLLRAEQFFGDAYWASAFYNEWSRPQGAGRHGRYAIVAAGRRSVAVLRATKPIGEGCPSAEEDALFERVARHFIRGFRIHGRLSLAEMQQSAGAFAGVRAGFLVVDREARILGAHEPTLRLIHDAGLVTSSLGDVRLGCDHPVLLRLIRGAAGPGLDGHPRAGQVDHRGPDGRLLQITVVPIAPVERPILNISDPEERWQALDVPAALLHIGAPEEEARARVSRLAAEYGLTAAEAAVAVEAAKGDGRAAVAARLGIRETTVRSHLSAIFDKLGIRRQAELTSLVAGAASAGVD